MHPRALTAARHLTAPGARTFRTGNLRADCERWCRDHLPPRRTHGRPAVQAAVEQSPVSPAAAGRRAP
jgi:hypothetical protein